MKYKLGAVDRIDKTSFNFALQRAGSLVPIVCKVDEIFYQITGFEIESNEYLIVEVNSLAAINLAVAFYDNLSILSLSKIANLISVLGINYKDVDIFKSKNITVDRIFNAYKIITAYNESIKKYLDEKSLPNKTLEFLSILDSHTLDFLADYIQQNNFPSQQSVVIFIDQLMLNRDLIKATKYTKDFKFMDMRSTAHKDIDDKLVNINKLIIPAKIFNNDNYELPKINLSVTFDKQVTFDIFLKKLNENRDEINNFFDKLKKYDLY